MAPRHGHHGNFADMYAHATREGLALVPLFASQHRLHEQRQPHCIRRSRETDDITIARMLQHLRPAKRAIDSSKIPLCRFSSAAIRRRAEARFDVGRPDDIAEEQNRESRVEAFGLRWSSRHVGAKFNRLFCDIVLW